jgi:hypothetical protein
MSRQPHLDEDVLLRRGFALLGVILLASAALALDAAREHMAWLSAICGDATHPHCGWCYATAGFALAGLSALVAAVRPARRVAPVATRVAGKTHPD